MQKSGHTRKKSDVRVIFAVEIVVAIVLFLETCEYKLRKSATAAGCFSGSYQKNQGPVLPSRSLFLLSLPMD